MEKDVTSCCCEFVHQLETPKKKRVALKKGTRCFPGTWQVIVMFFLGKVISALLKRLFGDFPNVARGSSWVRLLETPGRLNDPKRGFVCQLIFYGFDRRICLERFSKHRTSKSK